MKPDDSEEPVQKPKPGLRFFRPDGSSVDLSEEQVMDRLARSYLDKAREGIQTPDTATPDE